MPDPASQIRAGSAGVAVPDEFAAERLRGAPAPVAAVLACAAADLDRGDAAAAAARLREARVAPDAHAEALRVHGLLLARIGRPAAAVALLRQAVRRRPRDVLAHDNLVEALLACSERAAAEQAARDACAGNPESFGAWFLLGSTLDRVGDVAGAISAFERAVRIAPHAAAARMTLADLLLLRGDTARAVDEYRAAVRAHPELGEAWNSLANVAGVRFTAEDVKRMEAVGRRGDVPQQSLAAVEFALARAYEDDERYDAACAALERANARMKRLRPWDGAAFSAHVDEVLAAFAQPPSAAADPQLGREAIFIVGVPRSGSTLTEQILASHPQVDAGDELPDLLQVVSEESARRGRAFPYWVADATAADWSRLGEAYLARTRAWRSGRARFTDKQPNNWLLAGAALAMLPGARIIDCRRDALETCWACWRQALPESAPFSYDFADLAGFVQAHERAARTWRERFPRRVREQAYEVLSANPEAETRALLEFCGLPFDPACLHPERTERVVRTTSAAQVREPIRPAVARTARYGARLDPLRTLLGSARSP